VDKRKQRRKSRVIQPDSNSLNTCPTPATRNRADFAKAKEFTNPTCYSKDLLNAGEVFNCK
jgi:hypothetical protein